MWTFFIHAPFSDAFSIVFALRVGVIFRFSFTNHESFPMTKRLLLSVSILTVVLATPFAARAANDDSEKDVAECRQHLEKIYSAIQEYRRDHKKIPGQMHDLVPKYISDEDVFLCPKGKRENADHPYPFLLDPELKSHYIYEFSDREMGSMWQGGKTTMGEWKGMEMSVLGGIVPILRCILHDPALNVSFDGKFYESPITWEELVTDKVNIEDLAPGALRARLLRSMGDIKNDAVAFEALRESANLRKGVVMGKNLSPEHQKWNDDLAASALAAVAKADAFLKTYPESGNVQEARMLKRQMLFTAARAGNAEAKNTLSEMVEKSSGDKSVPEEERFQMKAMLLHAGQVETASPEYEKSLRGLMAEFPSRPEPYYMLLGIAQDLSGERGKSIVEEIASSDSAPDEARDQAKGLIKKMSLHGKPLPIKFTAVDGREVDLTNMKGKVVLVDFWATWCGPCVAELPHVKEAYEKFNKKGFEIVGISFDSDKKALEKFVKENGTAWPQYFDGAAWGNKFGREYGINSIPTMWLVDKEGKVADLNARGDLADKVEKLLAQ